MSGWIKLEKDLLTDPRVFRIGSKICNAPALHGVTLVLGCLTRMWILADTHVGQDDVMPLGIDEINHVLGVEGFCQLLPKEWLEVVDADHVKLPDYHRHNGTFAKKKAQTLKRVQRHRIANAPALRPCNGHALPDQDQDQDQDQDLKEIHTEKKNRVIAPHGTTPEWMLDFKMIYPDRGDASENWKGAMRAANGRLAEGHTPGEMLDGARRYAAYVKAVGSAGTQYVKTAAAFLGPDKHFLKPWLIPPGKAEQRLQQNLSAAEEFMRRTEESHDSH